LETSGPYKDLKPCVSVLFLAERLLPAQRFHSTFRVSEIHDHHEFTDRLELHTIELCKLEHAEPGDTLRAWGRFFTAKTDEEQELVAMTLPEVAQATTVLKELSADEKLRQAALDRDLNRAAYRIDMGAARREGRAEGLKEGESRGLRVAIESMAELLGFELDANQRQKMQAMSAPELEQLAQRIRDERRWPSEG
jgi:predicted transposase/invertase (TIGR01784 family)